MLCEDLNEEKVKEAYDDFEKQKLLLEEKNEYLVELNLQVDSIRAQIDELNRNPVEFDLQISRQIERERTWLEEERRKASLLKEMNISHSKLSIGGSESVQSNVKLDNLIKCIIESGASETAHFQPYSLVNINLAENQTVDNEMLTKIAKVKELLHISGDDGQLNFNSSLIDRVCSKINEAKICVQTVKNKYVLLDRRDLKSPLPHDGDRIILYEEDNNFLILKQQPDEAELDLFTKVNSSINYLLNSELLEVMCEIKYNEKGVSILSDDLDMNSLFKAFKEIKAGVEKRTGDDDDEAKSFINYIRQNKGETTSTSASVQVVRRQIDQLAEWYEQIDDSPKHHSIRSAVLFLKTMYAKRLQHMIEEACERKRAQVEMNIKSDVHSTNTVKLVLERKQNEIDALDKEIAKKKRELKEKNKEYDKKLEQLKLAKENWTKQNLNLNVEIENLQSELKLNQKKLDDIESNQRCEKTKRDETKKKVSEIKAKLDELNATKENLATKQNELDESLKSTVKERDDLKKETSMLQESKNHMTSELSKLKNNTNGLKQWISFLGNVYDEFLNNRQLFKLRGQFDKFFKDPAKKLHDKYNLLVSNEHFKKFHSNELESKCKQADAVWREQFDKYFVNILAAPSLMNTKEDVVEISGINLNYEDCDELLKQHVNEQLKKSQLFVNESHLCTLKDDLLVRQFLNGDYELIDGLKRLLDRNMKTFYVFKNKTTLKDTQMLTVDVEVVQEDTVAKLGDLKMKKVLSELKITYFQVLRCYAASVKLIAGNNIYLDGCKKLLMPGINVGMFAARNIVLPKEFSIDTSGEPGLKFRKEQAFSYSSGEAAQSKCGADGEDGFDGFCGQNAGHICFKANVSIVNLEFVESIVCKGGDGSEGQRGGQGQKGGKGTDTGDAQTEDVGACYLNPSFSAAFARIPGLNPDNGNFDIDHEKSGRGGNAGKAGFGGQQGFGAQVLLSDETSFIKNSNGDKENFEFSDNLATLKRRLVKEKKIQSVDGTAGKDASIDVKGGDSGEPGYYGLDHIMFVSGFFESKNQNGIKGDFSNLLKENPETKNGTLPYQADKYRADSILINPDLYAKRSTSFTVISGLVTVAAVGAVAWFAFPMLAAAAAASAAVGIGGVLVGIWASWACLGTVAAIIASIGASGFLAYTTLSGLKYEISKDKNKKNRAQILFKNRYCDDKPLRNENDARQNPRQNQNSRGKKGDDSKQKSENEREEHGKSVENRNEFETEAASLEVKSKQLSIDKSKNEAAELLQKEQAKLEQESKSVEATLNEVTNRVGQLNSELVDIEARVEQKKKELREVSDQIANLNELIQKEQKHLSDQQISLLNSIDSYLNTVDEQLQARFKVELTKIKESGKCEIQQKLKQFYLSLKGELEKELSVIGDKKMIIENSIASKTREKEAKKAELEQLTSHELESIMNKVKNQQKLAELNELQRKMKDEFGQKNKMEQTQEVMVINEFKQNDSGENTKEQPDLDVNELIDELGIYLIKEIAINENDYQSISKGKPKVSLSDLTKSLVVYANSITIDTDLVLGKLDFIISSLSVARLNETMKNDQKTKDTFKIKNIFENIKSNPLKFLDFYYFNFAVAFFQEEKWYHEILNKKVDNQQILEYDNFIENCSLTLRYQTQTSSSKNDLEQRPKRERELNELEKEILVFAMKMSDKLMCGGLNLNRAMILLDKYKDEIIQIANFNYPCVSILNGNMNRFYRYVIGSIRERMQKVDAFVIENLDKLIEIIKLLHGHLKLINEISQWKQANLLKAELSMCENQLFTRNLKSVEQCKQRLDQLASEKTINVFKLQIAKQILYPKMVLVLLQDGLTVAKLEEMIQSLLNSTVCNSESKEDFMYEFDRRFADNSVDKGASKLKFYPSSKLGFIEKYGPLFNPNLNQSHTYSFILDVLMNLKSKSWDPEFSQKLFDDFLCVLESTDDSGFTWEDIIDMYKRIGSPTFSLLSLARLEYLVSTKIQRKLFTKNDMANDDFVSLFNMLLEERTKNVTETKLLVEIKAAFYAKIRELLSRTNEKGQTIEGIGLSKQIFVILNLARIQTSIGKKCPPFCDDDEKSLKEIKKAFEIEKLQTKTGADVLEKVVFELSDLQSRLALRAMAQPTSDQHVSEEVAKREKELESSVKKKLDSIKATKSEHPVVLSLKNYVHDIENRQWEATCATEIRKKIASEEKNKTKLIKSIDEILSQDAKTSTDKKLQVVQRAIDESIGEADQRDLFVIGLIETHSNNPSTKFDFNKLIDIIDFNEIIAKQEFKRLLDYTNKLSNINSQQLKYKQLVETIRKEHSKMAQNISGQFSLIGDLPKVDKTVSIVSKLVAVAVDENGEMENISMNSFSFMDKARTIRDEFTLQMNPNTTSKEDAEKFEKNFLSSIKNILQERIAIDSGLKSNDELIYATLSLIKEKIIQNRWQNLAQLFKYYLHYMNVCFVCDQLDMIKIESALKELKRAFDKVQFNSTSDEIYQLVQRAIQIYETSCIGLLFAKIQQFFQAVDTLKQECETKKNEILENYVSKLSAKNDLSKKAQQNFVLELMRKHHEIAHDKCAFKLRANCATILAEIETKQSSKQIEAYLVTIANQAALQDKIPHILNEFDKTAPAEFKQQYPNKLNSLDTVDSKMAWLFRILFGDAKLKGEKCLLTDLIKLLVDDKKSTANTELILKYLNLIEHLMNLIYFNEIEEQYTIDDFRQELIETLNKCNDNQLAARGASLNSILLDSCYKANYYMKFIDRKLVDLELDDFNLQLKNVVNSVKSIFEIIDLIDSLTAIDSPKSKFEVITQLNDRFDRLLQTATNTTSCRADITKEFLDLDQVVKVQYESVAQTLKNSDKGLVQRFYADIIQRRQILDSAEFKVMFEDLIRLNKLLNDQISQDLLIKSTNALIGQVREEIGNQVTFLTLYSNAEYLDLGTRLTQTLEFIDANSNIYQPFEILLMYLAYREVLAFDTRLINGNVFDKIGAKVISEILHDKVNTQSLGPYIKHQLSKLDQLPVELAQKKLSLITGLISDVWFDLFDLKQALNNIAAVAVKSLDKKCIKMVTLLVDKLYKKSNYSNEIQRLMYRFKSIIENPDNLKELNVFCKIFVKIQESWSHEQVIDLMIEKLGFKWLVENMLTPIEKAYSQEISPNVAEKIIKETRIHILADILENIFIESVSKKFLVIEKNTLLNKNDTVKEHLEALVVSTYFDQAEAAFEKVAFELKKGQHEAELKQLETILMFKLYLFQSKEIIGDRVKWINLIRALQVHKASKKSSLADLTDILFLSRVFDDVESIIEFLKTVDSDLLKKFLILAFGVSLVKCSHSNNNSHINTVNKVEKHCSLAITHSAVEYLKLLVIKLNEDFSSGLKYQTSEIFLLNQIIDLTLHLRLYDSSSRSEKFLAKLANLKILKWENILKIKKIKVELGRDDDDHSKDDIDVDQLACDILQIEKNNGDKITQRFINLIKNSRVDDLTLIYMVKKFKRNVWELNEALIDSVLMPNEPSRWVSLLNEREKKDKKTGLSVHELVSLMKQHENNAGINQYVKNLLDRSYCDGQSLLEKCVQLLENTYKQSVLAVELDGKPLVSKLTINEIKQWAKLFKDKDKAKVNSIENPIILELVSVISRASELVNKFKLRSTQQMALLVFIDSILNQMKGRLANISTGEGKSLITISTTIAQIMLKGGTVDVLTSSEILAERDAEESEEMFSMFNINVSNNCDAKADADESLRRDRYAKNEVIYGEIGHFQRDLLLTKYYNKNIRSQLANCLIIDEVDSMCIDNMCNTLYISHQIADLRELKEIYVYIWQAVNSKDTDEHTAHNIEQVQKYIEKLIDDKQIQYPSNLKPFVRRRLKIWINNAFMAKLQIEEGNHYSVLDSGKKIGECVINDLQTGVEQMNTQWSEGLQQFIQLKHTNKLNEESLKAIFMSNYIFFMKYQGNIYGMTGTLGASLERELLNNAYGLDFFQLPRFKKDLNVRMDPVLVATRSQWLAQLKEEVNANLAPNRIIDPKEIDDYVAQKSNIESKLNQINDEIKKLIELIEQEQEQQTINSNPDKEKQLSNLKKNLGQLMANKEDLDCELENIYDITNTHPSPTTDGKGENPVCTKSDRHPAGRAVLIICENKKDVNDIVKALMVNHKHIFDYNGKIDGLRRIEDGFKKVKIKSIAQVRPGDIIVATNVAGRGTDFKISKLLEANGGLHVIMSYLPTNIRVELQGFGRSGRKGENGSGRMIVYDHRARNAQVNFHYLIDERDQLEDNRLQEIRIKMIPRVEVEMRLFQKFELLQEDCKKHFEKKSPKYWDLQMKSLHNKWAFWLDSMSDQINNVYKSANNEPIILEAFELFAMSIKNLLKTNGSDGSEGLIDEPNELIKLAKYNIENGNYEAAISNCDKVLNDFNIKHFGFGYYYKAVAVLRPMEAANWTESIEAIRKKWKGHEITRDEKRQAINLLKDSVAAFTKEIERIQMRSVLIAEASKKKNNGIGSQVDYFTRSNANEISAIQVHLNAANACFTQPMDIDQTLNTYWKDDEIFDKDSSRQMLEYILTDINAYIKNDRLSSKLKFKVHINTSDKNQQQALQILKNNPSFREVKNQQRQSNVLVVEKCSPDELASFDALNVDYDTEMYAYDRLNKTWTLFEYPRPFGYTKKRLVSEFQKLAPLDKCDLKQRENVLTHCLSRCLNKQTVFNLLKQHIGLGKVDSFELHKEHKTAYDNVKMWQNRDLFGDDGSNIKKKLFDQLEKNKYLTRSQLIKLLPDSLKPKALIETLLKEKFIEQVTMFEFANETKSHLDKYTKNIFVVNGAKLKAFDFSGFPFLDSHSSELIACLCDKAAKKEPFSQKDLAEILNNKKNLKQDESVLSSLEFLLEDDDNDQENNLNREFLILRKYLSIGQVSKSLWDHLKVDSKTLAAFDRNELVEMEAIIEELFKLEYFNINSIDLTPIDKLIDEFKSKRLVKSKSLRVNLASSGSVVEYLEQRIRSLARDKVIKRIEDKIKAKEFITETEIKENMDGFMNKLNFAGRTVCRVGKKIIPSSEDSQILDNERDLIQTKTQRELERLCNLVLDSILDTVGSLKRHKRCMVATGNLESYYRGSNLPREVLEYAQLQKNLVITVTEYQASWSWQTTVVTIIGIVQIAVGAALMAYPILGPASYHIGTGLISEGASDFIFAISNSGNISCQSYWDHKKWSLAITVATVGIGAYLSKGSAIAANIVKEQAARLGLKAWGKMVLKKIIGELGKTVINYIKSMAIDKIAEMFTKEFFKKFREAIMWMIRHSPNYANGINQIKSKLAKLDERMKKSAQQQTMSVLEEKVTQSEQELNESFNNQIVSLTGKVCGPLASQLGQASSVTQFSGMKLNKQETGVVNSQMEKYAKIARAITVALKVISTSNTAFELIRLVSSLLELVAKKLQIKIESMQSTVETAQTQNAADQIQQESETINEHQSFTQVNNPTVRRRRDIGADQVRVEASTESNQPAASTELNDSSNEIVQNGVELVEKRVFENIQNKVEHQIVSPTFNSLVDHMLAPLNEKLEKYFFSEFEDFKKQTLGYAEYDRRLEANKSEKGLEMEFFKDYVVNELNQLQFKSPIQQVDLEDMNEGKLEVEIDGELRVLDLSNKEDRDLIRDKIGSLQMRILPGCKSDGVMRLSRPNHPNYLKSWTTDKQVNEADLEVMAEREGRLFIIVKPNGEVKEIGPKDGKKEPFCFKFEPGDKSGEGHFMPMVMQNGKMVTIDNLSNTGNSCGIESLLYLKNREKLIKENLPEDVAHQRASESIHADNVKQELGIIKDYAIHNPAARKLFLTRGHESCDSICGGQKRQLLHTRSESHQNAIENSKVVLEEAIKNHLEKRLAAMFELKKITDELSKETNGKWKVKLENSAKYQDFQGENDEKRPISNKMYQDNSVFNDQNPITNQTIGEFQKTHAAHVLSLNIKNLEPNPNDSPKVTELKLQIKQKLAETTLLPAKVNLIQDRHFDKLQVKYAKHVFSNNNQQHSYANFVQYCHESFERKISLRNLDSECNSSAQVWRTYTQVLKDFK